VTQGDLLSFLLVAGGTVTAGLPQVEISYAVGTSGVGVTSVTASGGAASSGGTTPNITLASQSNDTVLMNATGGSAAPTGVAMPTCTAGADLYNTTSHSWSCVAATLTIASGTAALGTGAITSATCATVVTVAASGVAATDNIQADFNADPTSTTGYSPSTSGMLTVIKYPTSGNVNFKVCNNTSGSITPGAITLNWRVVR
jgi:hypothetical protein